MTDKDAFQGRSLAAAKAKRFTPGGPTSTPSPAPASPVPAGSPASPEAEGRMADVTSKPIVRRQAVAEGFLRLKPTTLAAIAEGTLPKGDPFGPARIAGILAAKDTPRTIPLCHPIPLTSVDVELMREERGVRCRATVLAEWKTGVEMEALCAVSAALFTVWDMAKALEKDDTGNYPDTAIEAIRVLRKTKGGA
jgi:cyclic pyranopterin phosphate synthase